MGKYIAVFDIPDDYVMGCACGKMCPNDGKIRSDSDFEDVYAQIEPLTDEQCEVFERFNGFARIIQDLGLSNAYDMPSFWHGDRKYAVIPTKYHKGYAQALDDVDREIRKRFGFADRAKVTDMPMPDEFV